MAETLLLKDGKVETLLSDYSFEEVLREYVGDDAVRYFQERQDELQDEVKDLETALHQVQSVDEFKEELATYVRTEFIQSIVQSLGYDLTPEQIDSITEHWTSVFETKMEELSDE